MRRHAFLVLDFRGYFLLTSRHGLAGFTAGECAAQMATIALDATYSVDPSSTGIRVFSRGLIESLPALQSPHHFLLCYRLSRIGRRRDFFRPAGPAKPGSPSFSTRLYQEPLTFWLPWEAELFHSLAQRPPGFRFRREIVTVYDVFPLTGRTYSTEDFQRKFSALLLEAVGRAARVIVPSRYTADQLLRHAGVAREKIRVVPGGVTLPTRVMEPEQRVWEREQIVGKGNEMVLTVAVLENRKNILNALRALAKLPAHYRLVLVGADGYGSEAIHDFIRREQLASRAKVLGRVPDERLAALYQAASAFLFPSLEEGYGLPVLEAMAHELPAVVSGTSSLPEVGGDAALYTDPNDPSDMAEKVTRAVEDATLRGKMIEQGRVRAREFSWQRVAERTCEVYDEVLAA